MYIDKKRITAGLMGLAYVLSLVALGKHLKNVSERLKQ